MDNILLSRMGGLYFPHAAKGSENAKVIPYCNYAYCDAEPVRTKRLYKGVFTTFIGKYCQKHLDMINGK